MHDAIDGRPTLATADLHARVRETAFALLITSGRPVSPKAVGSAAGVPAAELPALLDELAKAGWIDRDSKGQITGSGGLSLTDGPHIVTIEGATFRNWCAYDSLGIAAALDADAVIESACPVCDSPIRVPTSAGEPPAVSPERLWLAEGGSDLRADFCTPTVLLCSSEHAAVWAERHQQRGSAVGLSEGARLGREAWSGCARAVARVRERRS